MRYARRQGLVDTDSESVRTITENLGERLGKVDGTLAQFIGFGSLIDLTEQGNSTEIDQLNGRIADLEKRLSQREECDRPAELTAGHYLAAPEVAYSKNTRWVL